MERRTVRPIEDTFGLIARKIQKIGGDTDPQGRSMLTWRGAFPDVDFPEVDEALTGKAIEWDDRPIEDRYTYVAWDKGLQHLRRPNDTRRITVKYSLDVEGIVQPVDHEVDDPERQWYMWFDGVFRGVGLRRSISDGAKLTLIHYALQNRRYYFLDTPTEQLNRVDQRDQDNMRDDYGRLMSAGDHPERVTLRRLSIAIPAEVIDDLQKDVE